jgi:hypothetical protein
MAPLLASGKRAENVARARKLLLTPTPVIPIDAIKAINSNPETRTENNAQEPEPVKARLPLLRWSDDHHREVRARHDTAAPAERPVAAIRIDTS